MLKQVQSAVGKSVICSALLVNFMFAPVCYGTGQQQKLNTVYAFSNFSDVTVSTSSQHQMSSKCWQVAAGSICDHQSATQINEMHKWAIE